MKRYLPIAWALLAALLFGINAPLSKLLIREIDPFYLASFLYLGAGLGIFIVSMTRRQSAKQTGVGEAGLARSDAPYVAGMILLDIAAPILLLLGLKMSNAATVSLLGNFEIVSTAIIAMLVFREAVGMRLWLAIGCITASCLVLSFADLLQARISMGAVLVLLACVCWGFENNCTRKLSLKDPLQIVVVKGFGSGTGAFLIAWIWGKATFGLYDIMAALLLGFVSYGLSITFYVMAQRSMGAARTSAFYAAAPFIGVILSWLLLHEPITPTFLAALGIMCVGAWLAVSEQHAHVHKHEEETHEHRHHHHDLHHDHVHTETVEEHNHPHTHVKTEHKHPHMPDMHHRHKHG